MYGYWFLRRRTTGVQDGNVTAPPGMATPRATAVYWIGVVGYTSSRISSMRFVSAFDEPPGSIVTPYSTSAAPIVCCW